MFKSMVANVQSLWSTKENPGAKIKFRSRVRWILGSGWRWTLLLNSLRTISDILCSVEDVPISMAAQGDDSIFAVGRATELNPVPYANAAKIVWQMDTDKDVGIFCNEVWRVDTDYLATNIVRLVAKFACAPMPMNRLAFNKRVGEVRTALRDLFKPNLACKSLICHMNWLYDDRISVDAYERIYDVGVAMMNAGRDVWWNIAREAKLYGGDFVMQTIGNNA